MTSYKNGATSGLRLSLLVAAVLIGHAGAAYAQQEARRDTLIHQLGNGNASVRADAARDLGNIEDKKTVVALSQALAEDENPQVRRDAAVSLGAIGLIGDKEAIRVLATALRTDYIHKVRMNAASALSTIGGDQALTELISTLRNEDVREFSRREAAKALGELAARVPEIAGGERAVAALTQSLREDDDHDVRGSAASALGSTGDEKNLPVLIEVLEREGHPDVRQEAAEAIQEIGGERAIAALTEALQKIDHPEVRRQIAREFGDIGGKRGSKVLAQMLRQDTDTGVYGVAVRGLGNIKNETALTTLIWVLQQGNDYRRVRDNAARELAEFGGRQSFEALTRSLREDNRPHVREAVTGALTEIGGEQAIRALVRTLRRDDNSDVRTEAADALRSIAETLIRKNKKDTISDVIPHFEKAVRIAATGEVLGEGSLRELRATEGSLRDFIGPSLSARAVQWFFDHPKIAGASLFYSSVLTACLILFGLLPGLLLSINESLKPLDVEISNQYVSLTVSIRFLLLVGFFHYHHRVLDAWVEKHLSAARRSFSETGTVQDRKIHLSLPVGFRRQGSEDVVRVKELLPEDLRPVFEKNIAGLLIHGEGGSGKTSWACQIGRWAMRDASDTQLCTHRMLPILLETDFDNFVDAVQLRLRTLIDAEEPISRELLQKLLQKRHLLVIVDHFSEMDEKTRDAVALNDPKFPANALIVTSRLKESWEARQPVVVKPIRVHGDRLSEFIGDYLKAKGKRDLFPDSDFFSMLTRLATLVGERDVTVLFAKIYAEQMIAAQEEEAALPNTIPDLMLGYINRVNREFERTEGLDNASVHDVAKKVAWSCVRDSYRPTRVKIQALHDAYREKADGFGLLMDHLERKLRLIQTLRPAETHMKFTIDPLAEYLAALHFVEVTQGDDGDWKQFLKKATTKPNAPEAIRGFLLAVHDCCLHPDHRGDVPDYVPGELARLTGLSPEGATTSDGSSVPYATAQLAR